MSTMLKHSLPIVVSDNKKSLLFDANSLKDLLNVKKDNKKHKSGAVTMGHSKHAADMIQMILKEETTGGGYASQVKKPKKSVAKKRKQMKNKPSSKLNLQFNQTGGSGVERVRLYRLTFNNVFEFASTLNIPRNCVDYVERQYSRIRNSVGVTMDKIQTGYEQLSGTSQSTEVTLDDISLLLSFAGQVMDETIVQLIFKHSKRRESKVITQTSENKHQRMDVDEEDVFAQAEEDNRLIDTKKIDTNTIDMSTSEEVVEDSSTEVVDFSTFLCMFRAYLTLKGMTLCLGEMRGLASRTQRSDFPTEQSQLQYEAPDFNYMVDSSSAVAAGGAESVAFGDAGDHSMQMMSGSNGNDNNTMYLSSSSIHRPASDPRDNKQQQIPQQQSHFNRSQMLNHSVSMQSNAFPEDSQMSASQLPPLRLNKNFNTGLSSHNHKGKRKLLTKAGFDESLTRGTPRVLHNNMNIGPVDINALRFELQAAQEGVKQLNKMVDTNIAWVQSNCDMSSMSHMTSNFSSRTKQKCRSMATERIFHVVCRHSQITLIWTMKRWRIATAYLELYSVSSRYARIKSIDIMTNTLYEVIMKQFLKGWTPLYAHCRRQQMKEQTAAATEIQRIIRGFLGRVYYKYVKTSKKVIVIQSMFRKTKARSVVNEKRKRKAYKALQKKKQAAVRVMQRWTRDRLKIAAAKAEAERRRKLRASALAAEKIQKVQRGKLGRNKAANKKAAPVVSPPKRHVSHSRPTAGDLDAVVKSPQKEPTSVVATTQEDGYDENAALFAALNAAENAVENDEDDSFLALSLQASIDFVSGSSKEPAHTPKNTLSQGKGKSLSLSSSPTKKKQAKHQSIARMRVDAPSITSASPRPTSGVDKERNEITPSGGVAVPRLKKSATAREGSLVSPERLLSARALSSGRMASSPPTSQVGSARLLSPQGSDKEKQERLKSPPADKHRLQGGKPAPAVSKQQQSTRASRRSLTNDELADPAGSSNQSKKMSTKLSRGSFDGGESIRSRSPEPSAGIVPEKKSPSTVATGGGRTSAKHRPTGSAKIKSGAAASIQKVARGKQARAEVQKKIASTNENAQLALEGDSDVVENNDDEQQEELQEGEVEPSGDQIDDDGVEELPADNTSNSVPLEYSVEPDVDYSAAEYTQQQQETSFEGGITASAESDSQLVVDTSVFEQAESAADSADEDQFSPQTNAIPQHQSPTRDSLTTPVRNSRSTAVAEPPTRPRSCSPSFTSIARGLASPLRPFTSSSFFMNAFVNPLGEWLAGNKNKSSEPHEEPAMPLEVQEAHFQRQQSIRLTASRDENDDKAEDSAQDITSPQPPPSMKARSVKPQSPTIVSESTVVAPPTGSPQIMRGSPAQGGPGSNKSVKMSPAAVSTHKQLSVPVPVDNKSLQQEFGEILPNGDDFISLPTTTGQEDNAINNEFDQHSASAEEDGVNSNNMSVDGDQLGLTAPVVEQQIEPTVKDGKKTKKGKDKEKDTHKDTHTKHLDEKPTKQKGTAHGTKEKDAHKNNSPEHSHHDTKSESKPDGKHDTKQNDKPTKTTSTADKADKSKTAVKPVKQSMFSGKQKKDKSPVIDKPVKLPLPVATTMTIQAVERIQRMVRIRLAHSRLTRKRREIQQAQADAVKMVQWSVGTIQRVARGKQGRARYMDFYNKRQDVINHTRRKSAIKIQSRTRGMSARARVKIIRERIEAEKKNLDWLKSFQKGNNSRGAVKDEEEDKKMSSPETKRTGSAKSKKVSGSPSQKNEKSVASTTSPEKPTTTTATVESNPAAAPSDNAVVVSTPTAVVSEAESRITDAKILEIEEKIRRLEMIEKSVQEREKQMELQDQKAKEQQAAIAHALAEMERRAKEDDKERAQREQLLALAQGAISHRSEYASTGPKMSARISARNRYSQPASARDHEGPPTARSARGGAGIPPDAPRMRHGGEEWVQLWDPDEAAYYWYCERTQFAQWETPGGDFNDRETASESGTESGYVSEGAMTDYSTDHYSDYGGEYTDSEYGDTVEWQEYWDEQAQAKYWYNNNTGEASWTKPALLQDISSRSAMVPYSSSAGIASAHNSQLVVHSGRASSVGSDNTAVQIAENPGDWASFLDEDTGQEYWYNSKTGQSSWV